MPKRAAGDGILFWVCVRSPQAPAAVCPFWRHAQVLMKYAAIKKACSCPPVAAPQYKPEFNELCEGVCSSVERHRTET
jgi:hypothetical protein